MFRKALFLIVLFTPSFAQAQITIEGPKTGTMGYRSKAKLTLDVADPQIKCFPTNEDWMAVQDFSGQKWIDFVPGKEIMKMPDGKWFPFRLFTFVVAGNKENKTYLQTWEIVITPDLEIVPVPPKPGPDPVPEPDSELCKALAAAYLVSPDATTLQKLIDVYTEFKVQIEGSALLKDRFTSNKEAHDWLVAKAKGLGLQAVRDVVAEHFAANASRGAQWDKDKLSASVGRVLVCLKKLQK